MNITFHPCAIVMKDGKPCSHGCAEQFDNYYGALQTVENWVRDEDVIAAWVESRNANLELIGYPWFHCFVDYRGDKISYTPPCAGTLYIPGITMAN